MPELIRLDITVAETDYEPATGILVSHVSFGWEELSLPTGETCLRVHTDNLPLYTALLHDLEARLPDARCERSEIPDQDWTAAWQEFFTPVIAGKFVVLPPWLADTDIGDAKGLRAIVIEPKSAFGTGHHATTVLCLEALSQILDTEGLPHGATVLDLGTGTGVLGIGAAMHGAQVIGTDIDPVAVANARENCVANQVADRMRIRDGSTEAVTGEQFDLILANILAAPLKELAPHIMGLLKPGGRLVLSGILTVQADDVAACYTPLGTPVQTVHGDWSGLVW